MAGISSARMFGLLLSFDPADRGSLPASIDLSDKAACEIAELALRFWCGDEVRKDLKARRVCLAVAISDALVQPDVFNHIGIESELNRVAQRVARALDERNGTPLDGVVLLKKFATMASVPQEHAVPGKRAVRGNAHPLPGLLEAMGCFDEETGAPAGQEEGADGDAVEMVLPLIFAGDDGFVAEASLVMDDLPSQDHPKTKRTRSRRCSRASSSSEAFRTNSTSMYGPIGWISLWIGRAMTRRTTTCCFWGSLQKTQFSTTSRPAKPTLHW
jgi:hypothetical protein